ncbi:MAG: DUF465 domain-containing protein [Rhizobiaceae bacterium]
MKNLLRALQARHQIVQSRIDTEQRSKAPDSLRVASLKKIKLGIRDQMAMLERLGERRQAQ